MAVTTASGRAKRSRFVRFNTNGTWTVPSGVFAFQAEVRGGGAGTPTISSGDTAAGSGDPGSDSTVIVGGVTFAGRGAASNPHHRNSSTSTNHSGPAPDNSGIGAGIATSGRSGNGSASVDRNGHSVPMVRDIVASPGDSVAVTVGAGGGVQTGGSGYVIIRYEV